MTAPHTCTESLAEVTERPLCFRDVSSETSFSFNNFRPPHSSNFGNYYPIYELYIIGREIPKNTFFWTIDSKKACLFCNYSNYVIEPRRSGKPQ
jgi:hypothetical protein